MSKITPYTIIAFTIALLLAMLAALDGADAARVASKPNIIFVLTDDLGYGDLGVLFQNSRKLANNRSKPWELTPKLDRFATEGVQMRSHYCAAPVCACPS